MDDKELEKWDWPDISRKNKPELECPHGVGHGGLHGCDGCCHHISFKKAWKEKKK